MASVKRFEDLDVWKLSREMNDIVFKAILVKYENKYNPTINQLDKSCGSVMDNISEGFGRGGNREFSNFLSISKGSATETKSQLYRCLDRGYVSKVKFDEIIQLLELIIKKIGAFISYLNSSDFKGVKYISEPEVEYEIQNKNEEPTN